MKEFKDNCLDDIVNGRMKVVIDKVFNMSEVAKAHEFMESNQNIGKILLKNDM